MRELSEKELLILSNYLYIDECTKYSTINEMLDSCRGRDGDIDPARVGSLGIGGAMSVDDCTDLLVRKNAGRNDP